MKIRRVQYNIDYVHILTFKEEYKNAVIPYFGFDNLRYNIDNENTINESIRLIFNLENIALFFRKEGITIVFDGESKDLKSQNGIMKIFWELYERAQKFNGFKKTVRHSIICHSIKLLDKEKTDSLLTELPYMKNNPFGKMNDFCCIYEFEKEKKFYKFDFGNYSEKDIKKHDLMPFKATVNEDLVNGVGLMCRTEIREDVSTISFSKFKGLLHETEELVNSFKLGL